MLKWSDYLPGVYFSPEGGEGGAGGDGAGSGDGNAGGEGGAGGGTGDGQPKVYDEKYVKDLRKEAADNRKKAAELEAKLKEHEDAKLSETERLQKAAKEAEEKLTATEQRARTRLAKAGTLEVAAKLNFHDGVTAFELIRSKVEFDDDGEPTNIPALLEALAKEKPFLVRTDVPGGGNPANPASRRGGGGGNNDPKRIPSWGEAFSKK